MSNSILKSVEEYVFNLFKEKTPAVNIYHDLSHTQSVVQSIKKMGSASGLSDSEMEIVLIAGWFHDIGYFDTGDEHEEKSVEYAKEFLKGRKYPDENIDKIISCIRATKIPSNPKNLMEEVICDADLHHLGIKDFFDKNELFRAEYEKRNNTLYSEFDWIKNNIDFFTQHKFYTKYARDKYEEQKNINLLKLQKRLRKEIKKNRR